MQNHAPPIQATESLTLFTAPPALLFSEFIAASRGHMARSPVNVVPGTPKRGTNSGMKGRAAENTPTACPIHQNLDAQARHCDAGLAFDGKR